MILKNMKPKSRTSSYFSYITLFYLMSILQKFNSINNHKPQNRPIIIITSRRHIILRAGTLT